MASHATPFEKTRISFWVFLLVALGAVAGYFYLLNQLRDINTANVAILKESNAIIAEESQLGEVRKNLAQLDARRAKIASFFIDSKNIVPFLETIEGYGKSVSVTTKFSSVQMEKNPNVLHVTVFAQGSFTNVYRFISMLEAAPYELRVRQAEVKQDLPDSLQPVGQPRGTDWNATIDLTVSSINDTTK